jgi:hypothetical protein
VTCLEIRERLTEHSLGLLSSVDSRAVGRHLEWCPGCRKEATALEEGAAMMALALPVVEPPAGLESRIVRRITTAAGTNRTPTRRRVRLLAAATLAALLMAVGAVGWAVAERRQVQGLREVADEQREQAKDLRRLIEGLGVNPLAARLSPVLDARGSGQATIYSSPKAADFIIVSLFISRPEAGSFTIELRDRGGRVLSRGPLLQGADGTHVFFEYSGKDLSRGRSVTVLDESGLPVLRGTVRASVEA